MVEHVKVEARCPAGPLQVESWRGRSENGRFVVLRVLSKNRGRLWLMLEPDQWEELKRLTDEKLKEKT